MKPLAWFGVVLVVAGFAALAVHRLSYTTEKPVVDIGPLKASVAEEHTIAVPDMAGFGLIVVGGLLVFAGRRSA